MATPSEGSALLVVDAQRGFLDRAPPALLTNLIALCRQGLFPHVLASQFFNHDGSPFVRLLGWQGLSSLEEQTIPPELRSLVTCTFRKSGYSAATSELLAYLDTHRLTRIFLCGIDTDGCVLATAMDLFSCGIEPLIVADCCASSGGTALHESALLILKRSIGSERVLTSGDLPNKSKASH